MAARSNACSELVRFWLEARHGYLVGEGIPVPVPYALSDIDLVGLHPLGASATLPNGARLGPRVIVESKDEHDWDPTGKEFGQALRKDVSQMTGSRFIPRGVKGVKFSMLREEHHARAVSLFGTDDFDRLFVVHAIDAKAVDEAQTLLAQGRIHWLTIPAVVHDLTEWYQDHPRPTALRNTLVGDLFHLLFGFCGVRVP
jgi:hypothetical protein